MFAYFSPFLLKEVIRLSFQRCPPYSWKIQGHKEHTGHRDTEKNINK
jgi:hypothetical protein